MNIIISRDEKLQSLQNDIYEYIRGNIKERKYLLMIEYFYPTDKMRHDYYFATESLADSNKIKIFCVSWFNFYFQYYYSIIPGHINEIFVQLMLKYKNQDCEFFASCVKKHTYDIIFRMMYVCSNYIFPDPAINQVQKFKCGQKFIPLNLLEAQNPFNISYSTWKEYFISKKVSNLVINDLTPGFAIFIGWMMVKTGDKYVYDNVEHINRMERSKIAEKIVDIIMQAQTYTYQQISDSEAKSEEKTSWLSAEFKKLYYMIRDAELHTKYNIIMSNVSLCIMTEYLGRTLYDSSHLSNNSKQFQKYMMNITSDEHFDTFRRYLFEICYNLYLLNEKLGVIHGDLHLNNILLNLVIYIHSTKYDTSGRKIVYILNDKQYMFPFNFYYASLVDFSRCIIRVRDAEDLSDKSTKLFPFIGNEEEFHNSQAENLYNYLLQSKSIIYEWRHQIYDTISEHYDVCFKLFTILDIYNFTSKLGNFLRSKEVGNASPRTLKLVDEMNKFIDEMISTRIQELLELKNFEEIKDMVHPNIQIIEKFFSGDVADEKTLRDQEENICDMYCAENEMKYDIDGKLPIQIAKKWNQRREAMRKKNNANMSIVNVIMKRQREKHP